MLGQLARRLGLDILGGADPDELSDDLFLRGVLGGSGRDPDEILDAGPRGLDFPVEYGWVRDTMLVDGRWRIAPPELIDRLRHHRTPTGGLVLAPRREMAWSNSVRYGGRGDEPLVRMNPLDAAEAEVPDGRTVTVASTNGSIAGAVAVDARVRAGVVSITHGRTGASPGSLTSAHQEVDPLTTMPHASGLPVSVSPADPADAADEPATP